MWLYCGFNSHKGYAIFLTVRAMSISLHISENDSLTHSHCNFTRNESNDGRQFVHEIFKCILLTENIGVLNDIPVNIHSNIFSRQIALEDVVCKLILNI